MVAMLVGRERVAAILFGRERDGCMVALLVGRERVSIWLIIIYNVIFSFPYIFVLLRVQCSFSEKHGRANVFIRSALTVRSISFTTNYIVYMM